MIRNTGLPDGGLGRFVVAPPAIRVASPPGAGALASRCAPAWICPIPAPTNEETT